MYQYSRTFERACRVNQSTIVTSNWCVNKSVCAQVGIRWDSPNIWDWQKTLPTLCALSFHTDVNVGTMIGDTIPNGIIRFYSFPFPSTGITLSLTVTSGYVNCYASDRYRNPDQYQYDWFVDVRNYFELYLDPRAISRPVGRFLYVSFLGVDSTNVYQVNSTSGDTLTVGKPLGSPSPFILAR